MKFLSFLFIVISVSVAADCFLETEKWIGLYGIKDCPSFCCCPTGFSNITCVTNNTLFATIPLEGGFDCVWKEYFEFEFELEDSFTGIGVFIEEEKEVTVTITMNAENYDKLLIIIDMFSDDCGKLTAIRDYVPGKEPLDMKQIFIYGGVSVIGVVILVGGFYFIVKSKRDENEITQTDNTN